MTNLAETGVLHSAHASASGGAGSVPSPGFLDVSTPLILFTWLTFVVVAFLLYKVAWKPILRLLDEREGKIRKGIEDAEAAKSEREQAGERSRQTLAEAQARAERLEEEARASAEAVAASIRRQAEEDARRVAEEAQRDIGKSADRAREALRAETAEAALTLAGRLMAENMDTEKNRALVRKLAAEL